MANLCTITGVIRDSTGAPVAGATVHAVSKRIRPSWDGAEMPKLVTITADGNGAVSFDLAPGHYDLSWRDGNLHLSAPFAVPNDATADLQDLFRPGPDAPAVVPYDAPDNDTCRIYGTLRRSDGQVAANETVHIVQDRIRKAWDGAAMPVVQHVTADGNGVVDFDLIPGHYRLVWQEVTQRAEIGLWVPDTGATQLNDAVQGRVTPVYLDGSYYLDGQLLLDGTMTVAPTV